MRATERLRSTPEPRWIFEEQCPIFAALSVEMMAELDRGDYDARKMFQCFQNRVLSKCPKAVAHHSEIRLQCGLSPNEREAVAKMRAEVIAEVSNAGCLTDLPQTHDDAVVVGVAVVFKRDYLLRKAKDIREVLFGDGGPGG
jgi:hypothetical protein